MNIFVAKLDYSTTVNTIRDIFSEFGEVSDAKIIMDRDTGKSKGYGFVEMPNDDEGYNAINELNGSEIDGREILVKKSEPRENNDRRGGGGNRFNNDRRGGGGDGRRRRFVRNDNRDNNRGGGRRFNRDDQGDRYSRDNRW